MGMTAEALVELKKVFKAAEENENGLLDQVGRCTIMKVNCIFLGFLGSKPTHIGKELETRSWKLTRSIAGDLHEHMPDHQNPHSTDEVLC